MNHSTRIPKIKLAACVMWALVASVASADTPSRPNFLFIAIDDLNDFAGYVAEEPGNFLQVIYPDATIRAQVCKQLTPNLDKLARNSAPFARAYCPSALCGPSRTSLMTGVLPHRSGYYNHQRHFRTYDTLKDAVTLPQQLKNSGYFTTGLGKLFHKPTGTVNGSIKNDWADARNSWSVWLNHSTGCNGGKPGKYSPPNGGNMVFGRSRLPLENSGDWMAADFIARLLEHGEATMKPEGRRGNDGPASVKLPSDQPFFLGCGLFRPHLPFYAPSEFFDLFPTENMSGLNRESLEGIVADLDDLPTGAERFSDFKNGKMRVVMDHAKSLGADEEVAAWRAMVQSYLACVAYADACLGRLIEGYEKSPRRDHTVLFLWSDHGYHLGSKYHVAKQALWEEANRVQFIVHDPRKPKSCDGRLRRQIVSLNDLYPTICEMAGTEVGPQVEVGRSLVSLIDDADAEPVHDHLLMTYQEGNHSIRTATHKLSRYKDKSIELYDMLADPTQSNNLAGKAEVKVIQEKLLEALDNSVASTEGLSATSTGSDRPVDRSTLTNNPLQVDGHDFYAADPSVVIADDGRLFMFPTTDNRDWEKQFGWSSYSTNNLVDWTNHGVVFSKDDSAWGVNKAWAPDVTKKDGKYYLYYYFNNGGGGKGGVGVAVADQPEGPFRELTNEKLCRGHDPAVFADDDGRYWMYLQDKVYELGDDMASLKSGPVDLNLEYRPEKFEAAYVFKRNDIYYFTIARGWNNLIYYTGDSPTGPFEYRGEFMKPYGGNNHHSIIQYKGRWILFYHEWVKDDPIHQRRLRAEYLNFNDDGTIQLVEPTEAGVTLGQATTVTEKEVVTRTGDWTVDGEEILRDQHIRLDGSLILPPNSKLTLTNCTLEIIGDYSRQHSVEWQGGTLVTTNCRVGGFVNDDGTAIHTVFHLYEGLWEATDTTVSYSYGISFHWEKGDATLKGVRLRAGPRPDAIILSGEANVELVDSDFPIGLGVYCNEGGKTELNLLPGDSITASFDKSNLLPGVKWKLQMTNTRVERWFLFLRRIGGWQPPAEVTLVDSRDMIVSLFSHNLKGEATLTNDLSEPLVIGNLTLRRAAEKPAGISMYAMYFSGEETDATIKGRTHICEWMQSAGTVRVAQAASLSAGNDQAGSLNYGMTFGCTTLELSGDAKLIANRVHFGRPMTWTPENNIGEANVKENAQLEANNISVNKVRFRAEDNAKINISGVERLGELKVSEEGGSITVSDQAAVRSKPKAWIITDMSDKSLRGNEREGSVNDPDDISAMAGYLLMANEFETLGIVVASTHRPQHRQSPDQAKWAEECFGAAYQAELATRNKAIGGYPANLPFMQSCIKESAEHYDEKRTYQSLDDYDTIAALLQTASDLPASDVLNVLCWGSLTEPAILVNHCLATNQQNVLDRIRFIAHWTNSPLHQGSKEHPENVANCREDAAACGYLKQVAADGKIKYYECGAIGQHGIVSGGPKGKDYFDQFRTSKLGTIFVDGKFVYNGVDHSDSATYWVLLGNHGVSLESIRADGKNPAEVELANERKFHQASKRIHEELLLRSEAGVSAVLGKQR